MASSRKASTGSNYISVKRKSQWEHLMRKFSDSHKEKCKTVPLDIPREPCEMKFFPTGSQYEGTWDVQGMSGYGEYKFPNGVTYEGDTEDGMFHGIGELRYDNGATIRGKWNKGIMTERTLLFSGTLKFQEQFWNYCISPDRRFGIEYDTNMRPSGNSYLTADQPTKEIPPGFYDTGDGFYNPKMKAVYNYDDLTEILRSPGIQEQKWIEDNCRKSTQVPLGPRPDLYEKWSDPELSFPKPPPAAAGVTKSDIAVFRQQSIYEQEQSFLQGSGFFNSENKLEPPPQLKEQTANWAYGPC